MTPKKYRKKPVEIEAMQWDGTAAGASPIIALRAERDEALAEVERLRGDAIYHQHAHVEAMAEVERLREWKRMHSADVLSIRAEQAEVEGQRDESQAEVERLRQAVDDAVHLYHEALEERDEARAGDQS